MLQNKRIMPMTHMPKHSKGAMQLNSLLIDLKLQLTGHEHQPITMERFSDLSQFVQELEQCQERVVFDVDRFDYGKKY